MKKVLKKYEMVRTMMAISIALLVGFSIILLLSQNPISAINNFIIGPITKKRYIGNVVTTAIPLIFSGLAMSLLFASSQFNMGAEGVFYFSGLIAAIIGIVIKLPVVVHAGLAITVAGIIGALVIGLIGLMKAKYGTSELVVSLMFNSILYGIGLYILNYYFRESNTVVLKSFAINKSALLHKILPGTSIHSGLILALLAIFICHFIMEKSKLGYEINLIGTNPEFAKYSGINIKKVIVSVSLIAGLLSGIGGGVEILGIYDSFKWTALPGLGFDGALIAMLAKNKPKNVLPAALFLSYIRIGADLMSRLTDIPAEMVGIMQGIIILLISGRRFLQNYKNKLILEEVNKNELTKSNS